MSVPVIIPTVGESITSGTISEWHQNDGDSVRAGDLLLTLETDKISTEIPADADGILRIQVEAGEEVQIGATVATLEPGSAEPPQEEPSAPASVPQKVPQTEAPPTPPEPEPEPVPESPSAHLQVVEEAVEAPLEAPNSDRVTRSRMSPLRRKIAAHLVNAQQSTASLTTFNECDMSAVMNLRRQLQESFVERHGVKLGFMSFFVKAVVEALQSVPAVNGRIEGEEIVQNHFYDIGIAIGTERGLIVPVLRNCDQKGFAEIEKEILAFATKAKEGKIQLSDLQGGVLTISNGGIYGSLLSTPILNYPQSAILGMHAIQERPIAVDGEVVIRPMMNLALSYDHRLIDGKEAVTFLVRCKECIEHPSRMLFESLG